MVDIILTCSPSLECWEIATDHLNKWLEEKCKNKYYSLFTLVRGYNNITHARIEQPLLKMFIDYVEILDWPKNTWIQLIVNDGMGFRIINIRGPL